eukprot:3461375-Prymnesium_polylepis.1
MSCSGACWASDPSLTAAGGWVQFDFGAPRYVDMIQLYQYNSDHGGASARALASADVQVPNGTSGGWRTV